MSYIIPPINAKGKFTLSSPFNSIINPLEEYTVVGIRSLEELAASDPLTIIYKAVGLTDIEYEDDRYNNVPIVVLLSTAEEYIYVPATKVITMPVLTGKQHQEKTLAIPLGLLPDDLDLSLLQIYIHDTIYDVIGVDTNAEVLETSSKVLLDDIESKQLQQLRDNIKIVTKSYRTLYNELVVILTKKNNIIKYLENHIKYLLNNN